MKFYLENSQMTQLPICKFLDLELLSCNKNLILAAKILLIVQKDMKATALFFWIHDSF